MKKFNLIAACLLTSILTFTACSSDEEGNQSIVGKWGNKEIAVTGIDAYLQPLVNQTIRDYFRSNQLPCEKNSYIEFSENGIYISHNLCNESITDSVPYKYNDRLLRRGDLVSEVESITSSELRIFNSVDSLFSEYPDLEQLLATLPSFDSARILEIYQRK